MSNPLALKEEDLKLLLAAGCHIGAKNCNPQMRRYTWRRRNDGVHLLHLGKTWEKLILAARVVVAIENPEDVVVISARTVGQRAVFKFLSTLAPRTSAAATPPVPSPTRSKRSTWNPVC